MDEYQNNRLPAYKPSQPIQKLSIHHVRLFPRVWKHLFQVNFLMTERTSLFLANNTPSSNTKFVKPRKRKCTWLFSGKIRWPFCIYKVNKLTRDHTSVCKYSQRHPLGQLGLEIDCHIMHIHYYLIVWQEFQMVCNTEKRRKIIFREKWQMHFYTKKSKL